jgi:hypothetical protein
VVDFLGFEVELSALGDGRHPPTAVTDAKAHAKNNFFTVHDLQKKKH